MRATRARFLPQIKKKPEFGLILIRQTPALAVYDSTIAEKSELVKHLREKSRKFARKGEFPQTKAAALVCAKRARMVQYPVRNGSKAAPIWVRETVKTQVRGRKPFCGTIVPGGVYGGGARRPHAVRETGRSKPNEAGSSASELASVGGREAAGAPRTRSEAKSAGAEHRASVSAGRCEGVERPC